MSDYYNINLFGETVKFGLEEKENEIDLGEKEDKRFNVFLLTDAVAARDKRQAWVIYRKALVSGMVADEIFWRVVWGVKALLLTAKSGSTEESGLNPFVYKKNKNFLKNWKEEDLEKLSEQLTIGYHRVRRGFGEMETFLEKVFLGL